MSLLQEQDRENIKKILVNGLKEEVRTVVFTQESECEYCEETKQLLEELSQMDKRIKVEAYDFIRDHEKAREFNVDKTPAILLLGKKGNTKIRFFGMPAGYEFGTLLEDLIDVSNGISRLSPPSRVKVSKINLPVHIQVFVTLTCPHCPRAVRTAHQIALENELVTADMIEVLEFRELVQKHNVVSVPKIVIDGKIEFIGALSESQFIDNVISALYI